MLSIYQYKLYLNAAQAKTLSRWLGDCCWVFNQSLEHRIKSYRRRKESTRLQQQSKLLTLWRTRINKLRDCPVEFERDAIRRVDRGMRAFFRRCKAGEKPGFPRFKASRRYDSMECLATGRYLCRDQIRIPNLGFVRCRGRQILAGTQKSLRIIRRVSGWYAQVLVEATPKLTAGQGQVGVDVGLEYFATLSDGTHVPNPRWAQQSARRLRALQRRISRRTKGSAKRRRAVKALQRHWERVSDQRRTFCHTISTDLVRRFRLIAIEKLNIKGMARSRFGKSILDAAWGILFGQLRSKAEDAGSQLIEVDPRGTSQECPNCGRVQAKRLSERWHTCGCGLSCQRDHAAAQVILARAAGLAAATRPWRDPAAGSQARPGNQAGPVRRVGLTTRCWTTDLV